MASSVDRIDSVKSTALWNSSSRPTTASPGAAVDQLLTQRALAEVALRAGEQDWILAVQAAQRITLGKIVPFRLPQSAFLQTHSPYRVANSAERSR